MRNHVIVYAVGAIGLGALGLVIGDLALQWQPLAQWVTPLACLGAILLIGIGALTRLAAASLSAMLGSFAVLAHIPMIVANPGGYVEWTMFSLAVTLTGAVWVVTRMLAREKAPAGLRHASPPRGNSHSADSIRKAPAAAIFPKSGACDPDIRKTPAATGTR